MKCLDCENEATDSLAYCPACRRLKNSQNTEELSRLTHLYMTVGIISAILIVVTFIVLSVI
ncbi:MAG: hypothetical protein WD266_08460 [Balneolales bacterium]